MHFDDTGEVASVVVVIAHGGGVVGTGTASRVVHRQQLYFMHATCRWGEDNDASVVAHAIRYAAHEVVYDSLWKWQRLLPKADFLVDSVDFLKEVNFIPILLNFPNCLCPGSYS
ncbi:MAG: hypothetical protein K6A94_03850 [Bacteroidales bacterium]|nr:hypothetical protein [Bacteroidales bacterium]